MDAECEKEVLWDPKQLESVVMRKYYFCVGLKVKGCSWAEVGILFCISVIEEDHLFFLPSYNYFSAIVSPKVCLSLIDFPLNKLYIIDTPYPNFYQQALS